MSTHPKLTIDFYPWNIEHTAPSMPVKVVQDDPLAPLLAQLVRPLFSKHSALVLG